MAQEVKPLTLDFDSGPDLRVVGSNPISVPHSARSLLVPFSLLCANPPHWPDGHVSPPTTEKCSQRD